MRHITPAICRQRASAITGEELLKEHYVLREIPIINTLHNFIIGERKYLVRQFEIVSVGNLVTMKSENSDEMQMDTFVITPYSCKDFTFKTTIKDEMTAHLVTMDERGILSYDGRSITTDLTRKVSPEVTKAAYLYRTDTGWYVIPIT